MLVRLAWALGLVCAISVAARAQDKPDYAAAKKHYLAAKQAQQKGDTDGAVRSYVLAYDITKDPSLFKQIAVAYEAGGKKSEAAVYYRRYLAEAKPGPDVDEVRAKLAAMQGGAAKDTASAATRKSALPPEPPKLPPEPSPAEQKGLAPLPPVPAAPALFQDKGAGWQRTAAWVSVGLAAVALTTGTVLATSSLSREEDVRRLLEFREPGTERPSRYQGSVRDDYRTKDDEGKKLSRYATYSFIGAGALAGGAVLFFILDATRGVEAKGTAFAPIIGRDQLGVSAGWEF